MQPEDIRKNLETVMQRNGGVIPLEAAWVCRSFLPAGHRLGLDDFVAPDKDKRRGEISERWLASTTKAGNAITTPDEGFSYINLSGVSDQRLLLREAVMAAPILLMGEEYATRFRDMLAGGSLGRLAKIYDFAVRIMFHLHQMELDAAEVGMQSKREAYYFPPGVPMLGDDTTFFGLKPELKDADVHKKLLAYYLTQWQEGRISTYAEDWILNYSTPEKLRHEVGFLLPSGGLHAPGSAFTIELQEPSDVLAMLQACLSNNTRVDPELLYVCVHPNRRASLGVHAVVNQVNWDVTCDPKFTDKYRLVPTVREEQSGGIEEWIYYGAPNEKFTGTKVTVRPGESFRCQDNGGYNVLVWDGKGTFNGYEIEGTATRLGDHKRDEFFVPYQTAKQGVKITNTGTTDLVLIKFFGPGVNDGITPLVKAYQPVK